MRMREIERVLEETIDELLTEQSLSISALKEEVRKLKENMPPESSSADPSPTLDLTVAPEDPLIVTLRKAGKPPMSFLLSDVAENVAEERLSSLVQHFRKALSQSFASHLSGFKHPTESERRQHLIELLAASSQLMNRSEQDKLEAEFEKLIEVLKSEKARQETPQD
jgi:hypothetical protein